MGKPIPTVGIKSNRRKGRGTTCGISGQTVRSDDFSPISLFLENHRLWLSNKNGMLGN
jgi:hypothetical protein